MECKYGEEIRELRGDVREIKADVRSLLKFKWKAHGIGIAGGILAGFVSVAGTIFAIAKGVEKWLH